MNSAKLVMRSISKRFGGIAALEQAGLEVRAGEAHALMGANGAGKSTMMNVLGGVVRPDHGQILIDGEVVSFASPIQAKQKGVSFVHQELNMLPSMTVAENVMIDAMPTRGGLVDRKAMRLSTAELLRRLDCTFSPDTLVETLSMGDRQMVEVARALVTDPGIVIFDEPTSSLSEREKRRLFDVVLGLKRDGVAVIYITHFLEEIFEVCDRVTVMRNGTTIETRDMHAITAGEVVTAMLGSVEAEERVRPAFISIEPPLLAASGLSRDGAIADVGFEVRPGEVVGLWGLLGSGRTEILRAIVGLDPLDAGELRWRAGDTLDIIRPDKLHRKVGFVTEDRRGEGLLLPLSVAKNISFGNLDKVKGAFGMIDAAKEKTFASGFVERLRIKLSSLSQPVRTLSGGNQQKVVFARWLGTRPKLFMLDEPTRGLDVSAKTEILRLTAELATEGAGVIFVSSELEEMMRVCDRYLVVHRGRIVANLYGDATKDDLMHAVSDGRVAA
ncbi:sugar ABC transporter ATP-binding protein [Shinella sumterensis]|uniref:sugar ABC transporter ATP-binding protein n=1 Tax=Shinella sumterensis TaxID=1967501 RepID=UPI003F87028F